MCDTTAARVALIRAAAAAPQSNCFDWLNDEVELALDRRTDLHGLTPPTIKRLTREWIVQHNGPIYERVEHRENWMDRREYWYFVIVPVAPVDNFPRGLFVEMELEEPPDPDCPVVNLLNAHPELGGPRLPRGGTFLT
jgi:hypothetical protein